MMIAARAHRILVVDDDPVSRRLVRAIVMPLGIEVIEAADGQAAVTAMAQGPIDAVILDLRLPDTPGLDLLSQLRASHVDLPFIVSTAYADVKSAVRATQLGAFDYLTKPIDADEFLAVLHRAFERQALLAEVEALRRQVGDGSSLAERMGHSAQVRHLIAQVHSVADTSFTVLVQGETGTGKELVSEALHRQSRRREGQLVALDCGAIPEALIESELFGHERGAFTGADRAKEGRFQLARGGTILLDEVGNLPLGLQSKLLRVLESREVTRVGGTRASPLDVRFIAATNDDLRARARDGRFREDLYFRLAQVTITVPPLRERLDDLPYLARRFQEEVCLELRRPVHEITPEAMAALQRHLWPGNVRELRNVVRLAVLRSSDQTIDHALVGPLLLDPGRRAEALPARTSDGRSLKEIGEAAIEHAERAAIRDALLVAGGNKSQAARALRTDFKTLHLKMKRYAIRASDFAED